MSQEDFSLESLATYLQIAPAQVAKLADRGRLPGRRIGGQWRFSRAEIHHWMEERIGNSGHHELAEVEVVLNRAGGDDEAGTVSVSALLKPEAVAVPLQARTRNSAIDTMVELAASSGFLWDPNKMADAVRAREGLHPTALDNGVALLHPRRPMATILAEPLLALGRTYQGIPFGGGGLTDIFFLICSVDDRGHLKTLARLSRLISDGDFLTELRAADDAAAAYEVVLQSDERLNS